MTQDLRFTDFPNRRGTNCAKWDKMEDLYGVAAKDGLAMWVADMDIPAAPVIQEALQSALDHGIYGYAASDAPYREAIAWWMKERHGWTLDPSHIFSTDGLVNAVALCLQAYSAPGDGVVIFTPVYHAFAKAIRGAGRDVVSCELPQEDERYRLDLERAEAQLTGRETMLILCSPHNPGGRVWRREELVEIAAFAERHGLTLISDEIHHDLVFPGARHIPMTEITEKVVMLTAPSKTFNIAGLHCGQVTIEDAELRRRFKEVLAPLQQQPNTFGLLTSEAAYSPRGAAWVDALLGHLEGNRRAFDAALDSVPGVRSMPLEATYLAWVDFSGTGMTPAEVRARVEGEARIAANYGETFGPGGESFLRFNLATRRALVEEAGARLQRAFADLQ